MKKATFFAVFLAINLSFSHMAVKAESEIKAVPESISIEKLGVEEAGILPSNPFYFFKKWRRDIQRTLAFDSIKKINLELQIINEKAAEIKKMETVAPGRTKSMVWALSRYKASTNELKNLLVIVSLGGTAQDEKVDQLLDKIFDRLLKHELIFDEIKNIYKDNDEINAKIDEAKDGIFEIIAVDAEKLESIDSFIFRLRKVVNNQPEISSKNQKMIDMLSFVEDKVSDINKEKINEIKSSLIIKEEEQNEQYYDEPQNVEL